MVEIGAERLGVLGCQCVDEQILGGLSTMRVCRYGFVENGTVCVFVTLCCLFAGIVLDITSRCRFVAVSQFIPQLGKELLEEEKS
jgi:hypothetical protein